MSRSHSLRMFFWFLTTWVTVENASNCVFVLISMLGWVKNSYYSSCLTNRDAMLDPMCSNCFLPTRLSSEQNHFGRREKDPVRKGETDGVSQKPATSSLETTSATRPTLERENPVGPIYPGEGGGVLLYISYMGMCRTLGYGFRAVLVWNRVCFLPF